MEVSDSEVTDVFLQFANVSVAISSSDKVKQDRKKKSSSRQSLSEHQNGLRVLIPG